jgi:hypothetical protein
MASATSFSQQQLTTPEHQQFTNLPQLIQTLLTVLLIILGTDRAENTIPLLLFMGHCQVMAAV